MAAPNLPDSPLSLVLAKLPTAKRAGAGFMARCPAHDDREASLSLKEGTDQRVVLKCHAGCTVPAIVAAVGLTMADLFPAHTRTDSKKRDTYDPNARPRQTASYDYQDEQGALLYQAIRLEYPDGRKTFRQRRPDGNGGWTYSLGETRLVPYRLPELHQGLAQGRVVLIVEGEKDVETLIEAGYVATTNPMGAGKWRDEFAPLFRGAMVVVLPDNDDPGKKHAQAVAQSVHAAGAKWVRVCDLPDLPPKGDVTDWLDAGHDLDELQDVIGKAPLWFPDPSKRRRWKLSELWENESIMRPPPVIVPRMAWAARSTLVAAREKAGKSTLLGYVTAAVTRGHDFLGEPCQQGDVLLFGLEEFVGDPARRLKQFGADGDRVHLVTGFDRGPEEWVAELRQHIEDVTPVLVILDSLGAFYSGRVQNENDAAQMTAIVKPLTDVAHETGTALVILHHANKGANQARGSTAIMANVDVVCEFFAPDETTDPTRRRVTARGRVPVTRSYDVMLIDGREYVLAEGVGAVTIPVEQRIREVVRNRPTISANDLCDAVGGRRDTVMKAIHNMLATRELVNHGPSHSRMKLVLPAGDALGADL